MAFKNLNDSFQLARDTTRNRFALIRYDVQKSKADNLLLQQQITKQQLWMIGLIGMAGAIIAGLYIWYGKRKKRIQQESQDAIRDARLKTSQKVHDVVANGLYGIMNELEHRQTIDKEPLMNRIEGLYEKSRNISYEDIPEDNHANYDTQVHALLTAFANEQTKVIVVGNQQKFWNRITGPQKQELQLVLNEIMVNMKKHSQAKNVALVFKEENNTGLITYKDDGTGFPEGYKKGNGLENTVSRINSLNGAINFGKSEKGGVSIRISFPLDKD
jgi:signal transduction histidine kinase